MLLVEYDWDEQSQEWVITGPRLLVPFSEWHARYSFCRFWDATVWHAAWHATFPKAHHENRLGTGFNGDMSDPYGRWKRLRMPRKYRKFSKPVGRYAGGAQSVTPSANGYHSNPFSRTLGSRVSAEKREEKRDDGNSSGSTGR